MYEALCRELAMRKEYLKGEDIETVYFGGGTPSQLEKEDFELIFDTIRDALRIKSLPGNHAGS